MLRRYMACHDTLDLDGLAALLREDARLTMPPIASWYQGRAAIRRLAAPSLRPESFGRLRGPIHGLPPRRGAAADEYRVFVHPVVSVGAAWFDQIQHQRDLELLRATAYDNGVVGSYYRATRS